jgi:hypothetical protein
LASARHCSCRSRREFLRRAGARVVGRHGTPVEAGGALPRCRARRTRCGGSEPRAGSRRYCAVRAKSSPGLGRPNRLITGAIWDRGLPSFPVCSCLSVKSLWWVAAAVHERLDGDLREGRRLAVHLGDLAHFEVRPDIVRHVGELTRIVNAHGVGGFVFGADDWSASRSCAASRSRGSMVSISTEDGRFWAGTIIVVDTRR